MVYIQTEKLLTFKNIIDALEKIGLNIYDIENNSIEYNEFQENINNNNYDIMNMIKIYNKFVNVTDDQCEDINKIINSLWGIKIDIYKLNRGGCKHAKLIRSELFNNIYPVRYNPDSLIKKN